MRPFIAAGAAAPAAPAAPARPPTLPKLVAASMHFAEMQQNYLRQMSDAVAGHGDSCRRRAGQAPAPRRRTTTSASPAKRGSSDPRFDALTQAYLALRGPHAEARSTPRRSRTRPRRKLRFAVRQLVDAMSPANYLATNPEAMELAVADRRAEPRRRHGAAVQGPRQGPHLDDRRGAPSRSAGTSRRRRGRGDLPRTS